MPPHAAQRRILFLEKTLLERRDRPLRGVQLFNFHLIGDLVRLGHSVVVPIEPSWRERFQEFIPDALPELVETPSFAGAASAALGAAWKLRLRRFDVLLLGNVGRGVVPAVRLLRARGVIPRAVLIAHRTDRASFTRGLRRVPMDVVAVNRQIAAGFEGRVQGRVATHYGVGNADAFFPALDSRPTDAPIQFCVLGKLDPEWKGAGLAMNAFRAMPDDVQARCRLQLISYENPPRTGDERIIAHPWTPSSRIPELLRTMDILIVPSQGDYETFSQSIVQGMLTGLPIIASDLPVLVEKIEDGAGFIFKTHEELVSAMTTLALDADLRHRLGERARAIALARYVWDTERFVERFLFPQR